MKLLLLAAPALLFMSQAGQRHNTDEPAPNQPPGIEREIPAGPSDEPSSNAEPVEAAGPLESTVRLPDGLAAASPKLFAEKLSDVLGVEVVMPQELRRPVIIAPAEYPVPKLLKRVAKEAECTWTRVFDLARPGRDRPDKKPKPKSLLGPAGTATLLGLYTPDAAARAIERSTGCRVTVPADCPGDPVSFNFVGTPVETVIDYLADRLGCKANEKLVFDLASRPAALPVNDEQDCMDRLNEETEQKALLLDHAMLATGIDVDDERFPWETMFGLAGVVPRIGPDRFFGLIVQMQVEAEMRSLIRGLDPDTGGLPVNPFGNWEP